MTPIRSPRYRDAGEESQVSQSEKPPAPDRTVQPNATAISSPAVLASGDQSEGTPARYYLHLRGGCEDILDEAGQELGDMEAIREAVLEGARDVMGDEIKSAGQLDLRCRIDAEDEAGNIVHSLHFSKALKIIPSRA